MTTIPNPQPENIKTYPSTSAFPNKPEHLNRKELEYHYLSLRGYYKGLMISRGQFAAKNRQVQAELEKYTQEQQRLVRQLSEMTQDNTEMTRENQALYKIAQDLQELNDRQSQLVTEFKTEYEAIKNDRSNLLDITSFWDKFNRLMRAAYKLLNQGVLPKPVEPKKLENGDDDDDFRDTSPSATARKLLDDK